MQPAIITTERQPRQVSRRSPAIATRSAQAPVFVPPTPFKSPVTQQPAAPLATRRRFPEPSAALKTQRSFSDFYYADYHRRAAALVRSIRKNRRGDCSASTVFENAQRAYRDFVDTQKRLAALEDQLPENRTTLYPVVELGVHGRETSYAKEVIRYFDEWIDRVRDHGLDWTSINDLKQRKIESLKTLKSRTDAFLEDQKQSGLYALRVEATARRSALNSLMYEACCSVKLRSRLDCEKAARFIRFMARMHNTSKAERQFRISAYFLSCISKRLAVALANPSLR